MVAPADTPRVAGVWVQGPAGCGKSSGVRKLLSAVNETFYVKMRNQWWCGYQHQKYVICDDIDVYDVKLGGVIKNWTDRYAFTAEAKGGAMSIRPELVFLTSQYSIGEIWKDAETKDAILRRCYVINMFDITTSFPSLEEIVADLTSRNVVN